MRYLLDTNTVGHLMRGDPRALARLASHGTDRVCVCAITEAEIQFGLAKRPDAARLRRAAEAFLAQVDVLSFTSATAKAYGSLRVVLESSGMPMSPLDTLIAATALEHGQDGAGLIFVTNDHAFARVPGLRVEDWTA